MGGVVTSFLFLVFTLFNIPLTLVSLLLMGFLFLSVFMLDIILMPLRVLKDFHHGRYPASIKGTKFLRAFSLKKEKKAAFSLNLAAGYMAMGNYEEGGAYLKQVDRDLLKEDLKAVWENNYANFILGIGGSPEEALRICDQAVSSGFHNPTFHSTRGLALLRLKRFDDAIAEFCRSMEVGHQGPAELSETYYHLGRVWETKGDIAYARDHFLKAINVAPGSRYGRYAAEKLSKDMKT